jgi:hypothetical protein
VLFSIVFNATELDAIDVPGQTPKKPFSGLIAFKTPFSSNFNQAISSPFKKIRK